MPASRGPARAPLWAPGLRPRTLSASFAD